MPPQVMPPEVLARALELGLCRYMHISAMVTIPPATGGVPIVYLNLPDEELTGVSFEIPAINQMRLLFAPPLKDYLWRTFSLAWGAMEPAGISLDIVLSHGQYGMIMHEDPWIHSLVDYTYPHSLTLMRGRPEILIIENNSIAAQTIDVTIHLMSFATKEDWDTYQASLKEAPALEAPPKANTLEVLTEIRDVLIDMQKGIRAIPVLWKKEE